MEAFTQLRDILTNYLGIRCVFPATDEVLCRCMLELVESSHFDPFVNLAEDNVCRLLSLCDGNGSKSDSDPSSFDVATINYVLSVFFSHVPPIQGAGQALETYNSSGLPRNKSVPIPWVRTSRTSTPLLSVGVRQPSAALHPNIAALVHQWEIPPTVAGNVTGIGSQGAMLLVQEYVKRSLSALLMFHKDTSLMTPTLCRSAGAGAKDLRCRFLTYQLLQTVAYVHSQDLCLEGGFNPTKALLDDNMWLVLPVDIGPRVAKCVQVAQQAAAQGSEADGDCEGEGEAAAEASAADAELRKLLGFTSAIPRPPGYYDSLVVQWATGRVSNFEYLMRLNTAAGRSVIDPVHHPVFPWLTDFSVDLLGFCNGSPAEPGSLVSQQELLETRRDLFARHLRDLTKTKFRLSKGDDQLQTTYNHSIPPHHIPESLSELTYYIYMARITPLHVLRRVVRNEFVPGHYPHSMVRMYEWSPDECVPEFFTNESVFCSIHKANNFRDIILPAFADSPEKILRYHRRLLECDEVSEKLHLWIDLTFGHCLGGAAAVDHMNVHLRHTVSPREQLGDGPNLDKHPGCVQLFEHPHPPKWTPLTSTSAAASGASGAVDTGAAAAPLPSRFHEKVFGPANKADEILRKMVSCERERHGSRGVHSHNNDAFNSMSEKAKLAFLQDGQFFDSKQSLERPRQKDPTLLTLKNIPFTSLAERDPERECAGAVRKLEELERLQTFVVHYGRFLEPSYQLEENPYVGRRAGGAVPGESEDSSGLEAVGCGADMLGWDAEAYRALIELQAERDLRDAEEGEVVGAGGRSVVGAEVVRALQAEDVFSVGCVLAELYTSKPLFSTRDTRDLSLALSNPDRNAGHVAYFRIVRTALHEHSDTIPIVMRRLIASLLHFNPELRPSAAEVLQCCNSVDRLIHREDADDGPWSFAAEREAKGEGDVEGAEPVHTDFSLEESRFGVTEFLDGFCGGVFPSYFSPVYLFVGRLKLCKSGVERFSVLLANVELLRSAPLEGLGLMLPHVLGVLSSPKPFRSFEEAHRHLELDYIHSNSDSPMITHYVTLIDVLGARLGVEATEKLLMPRLLEFLNRLLSPQLLRSLLYSGLWQVILHRGGVRCYIRHFLPLLITYLVSGTLQNVSLTNKAAGAGHRANDPVASAQVTLSTFWSLASDEARDGADWLHYCAPVETKLVQQAAKVAISRLSYPDYMGPGICTRYVVPALLCLVGVPVLASASYHFHAPQPFRAAHLAAEDKEAESDSAKKARRRSRKALRGVVLSEEFVQALFVEAQKERPRTRNAVSISRQLSQEALVDATDDAPDASPPQVAASDVASSPQREHKASPSPSPPSGQASVGPVAKYPQSVRRQMVAEYISSHTQYEPQDMFVVRSLVGICTTIGELTTSELVLSKLFHLILPHLDTLLTQALQVQGGDSAAASSGNSLSSIMSAFMEVIQVLSGLLPGLSADTVSEYYLQASKWSHMCIPNILLILPLTIPKVYLPNSALDEEVETFEEMLEVIEFNRRCAVHLDLVRLLISCCMAVGSEATIEFVLPAVDKFYSHFVHTYSCLAVECKIMLKAFEIGAELFIPLVQLVGAEIFYTLVPHLNPRLEMWLISVHAKGECKTPPLPSNILPEAVGQIAVEKKEPKKGFFNWLSNKLSDSNTASGYRPGPASTSAPLAPNAAAPPAPSSPPMFRGPHRRPHATGARTLSNPTMSVDSAIMLQEFAIQMDRQSSLLMSARLNSVLEQSPSDASMDAGVLERAAPTAALADSSSVDETPVGAAGEADSVSVGEAMDDECAEDGDVDGGDSESEAADIEADAASVSAPQGNQLSLDAAMRTLSGDLQGEGRLSAGSFDLAVLEDQMHADIAACGEPPTVCLLSTLHKNARSIRQPGSGSVDGTRQEKPPPPSNGSSKMTFQDIGTGKLAKEITSDLSSTLSSGLNKITGGSVGNADLEEDRAFANSSGTSLGPINTNTNNNGSMSTDEQRRDDQYFDEVTWLLAGAGRWNMLKELEALTPPASLGSTLGSTGNSTPGSPAGAPRSLAPLSGPSVGSSAPEAVGALLSNTSMGAAGGVNKPRERFPAAQVSLTSPKITLDIAAEASSAFSLLGQNTTQFTVEDGLQCRIRCMAVNSAESLLLTSSRSGVKLWSLTAQPTRCVATYNHHHYVPFCANYLRCGAHMVTCDGSISVWDVETQKTLVYMGTATGSIGGGLLNVGQHGSSGVGTGGAALPAVSVIGNENSNNICSNNVLERCCFSHIQAVSPKMGVSPALAPHGDDQLLGCYSMNLAFFDFRQHSHKPLRSVAEWRLPSQTVSSGSGFNISSSSSMQHSSGGSGVASFLTCTASQDNYVIAGSSSGHLYVVDRRSGRLLAETWAHEGSVVKLFMLSRNQFLSVADKSSFAWEICGGAGGEVCRKLYSVRRASETPGGLSLNTVLLHSFEQNETSGPNSGKTSNMLYCLSGHKMSAGKLPDVKTVAAGQGSRDSGKYSKDVIDRGDEFRLDQSWFSDRSGVKIGKSRLHVASAALLPLRRLLLLGADDGSIKVVC